mmetsp:Transcript_22328/g.40208  ORF Transcript_22328/g.40208 Transcript_22328/m.40208 type:complete len:134 (+) Transcript_22328:2-403(+)
MKEDPQFARIYEFLASGPCQNCAQQGMGGMQCLMPFMMITGMNAVFDLLMRSSNIGYMPYGIFLLTSILSGAAATYLSWTVYKITRDLSPADGMEMGGSGYAQQGDASGPADPASQATSGFQAFTGEGNRLGG